MLHERWGVLVMTAAAHSFIGNALCPAREHKVSLLWEYTDWIQSNSVLRTSVHTSLCRNYSSCLLVSENEILSGISFRQGATGVVSLISCLHFSHKTKNLWSLGFVKESCWKQADVTQESSECSSSEFKWRWSYICVSPSCGNWFWESSKDENWDLTTVESGLKSKAIIPSLRNRSRINGIMNSWFI